MKQHPYCYPETEVLRNKLDIRDSEKLEELERLLSAEAIENLPSDIPITPNGYREIHYHIFHELYDWAGQDRDLNTMRTGFFCKADYIEPEMNKVFSSLNKERNLCGLSADEFAERASKYIGELNAIHPFLDGNGRTARAFLEILGEQAGHEIDLARLDPQAWNHASAVSFHKDDNSLIRDVIADCIVEVEKSKLMVIEKNSVKLEPLNVFAEQILKSRVGENEEMDITAHYRAMAALDGITDSVERLEPVRAEDMQALPSSHLRNIVERGDDYVRELCQQVGQERNLGLDHEQEI